MSNIFYKPYLKNAREAHFCYTREALSQRPIYPTYVLDGGGCLLINDVFGTSNSDKWLDSIMNGDFFDHWSRDGVFDWKSVFRDYIKDNYTPELEGNIWINRLYILMPLAQKYMITKEKIYADKWLELFSSWVKSNPYTDYSDCPRDLIWENMQVGTRTINIVNSIFMLGECDTFTEDDWHFIYASLRTHGEELLRELRRDALKNAADNHVLQMADAAIMLGVLFPEFFDTDECLSLAEKIVKTNIKLSIFDDGCNNEDSISYSHFIARLYLECELLLTLNGYKGVEGCADAIQRQYKFLYNFASPKGETLQIGDSYVMDAFEDIEFVNSVYPLSFSRERKTVISNSSKMSVLRNEKYSVYIDAMDMTEWHQHFGRPHFTAYAYGLPFVVDGGAINYDRSFIFSTLHSPKMHNVVYCDEIALTRSPSNEKIENVDYGEKNGKQYITVRNTVAGESKSYVWERTIAIDSESITVTDSVKASEAMHFTNVLHLPQYITSSAWWSTLQPISEDKKLFIFREKSVYEEIKTSEPCELTFPVCVDEKNKMSYSTELTRKHYGKEFTDETVITYRKIR